MLNIEDKSNRYQIIWDLGRRCSYACSYCPPHRNNKTSPFIDLKTLKNHIIVVWIEPLIQDVN